MLPNEVIACLRERVSAWKFISGVSSGVRLREDNLHTQEEKTSRPSCYATSIFIIITMIISLTEAERVDKNTSNKGNE